MLAALVWVMLALLFSFALLADRLLLLRSVFLPSAAALVVASFCDGGASLVAGIVNGVARVGARSAGAGVFHVYTASSC